MKLRYIEVSSHFSCFLILLLLFFTCGCNIYVLCYKYFLPTKHGFFQYIKYTEAAQGFTGEMKLFVNTTRGKIQCNWTQKLNSVP